MGFWWSMMISNWISVPRDYSSEEGLRGHNGLKSIAKELGSKDFFRLRIGIGRPRGLDVASFVLGRFSVEEEAELPFVWEGSARILNHWMKQGCPQKGVPSTYTLGLPGNFC